MVDFGKSDKMIKINGKVGKSNRFNDISFFIGNRIHQNENEFF